MTTAAPAPEPTATAAPAPAAATPAAAPAAQAQAPAAAPAAPAQAPAPAAGLFPAASAPAPAASAEPAPPADGGDAFAFLPAKYRVMGADGQLDLAASSQKLAEGYANAERRIGTGDVRPEKPDAYTFTPPDEFKDVPLDAELSSAFRSRAHEAGLSQKQYEWVMGEYFRMVPSVLDGAASMSAEQARVELQKVWGTKAEYEAGLSNADRARMSLPEAMREQVAERYGTDPLFFQIAAHFGAQLREDRSPSGQPSAAALGNVESLIASEAYLNPKHPEHARVSAQVQQHFEKRYGTAAPL